LITLLGAIKRSSRDLSNSSTEAAVLGRTSSNSCKGFAPAILPLDTKIEQTIQQKPRDNVEEEEEEL
jgi:hypothetical protein